MLQGISHRLEWEKYLKLCREVAVCLTLKGGEVTFCFINYRFEVDVALSISQKIDTAATSLAIELTRVIMSFYPTDPF